jgi:hypothetical protein
MVLVTAAAMVAKMVLVTPTVRGKLFGRRFVDRRERRGQGVRRYEG